MIDPVGRNKLLQDMQTKRLVNGVKDVLVEAFKTNSADSGKNREILELVVDRKEDEKLQGTIDNIGKVLVMIAKAVVRPLPKIFNIQGKVDSTIVKMPPVKITNLDELKEYFDTLAIQIAGLSRAVSMVPQPKIEMPKIQFPKIEGFDPEVRKLLSELISVVEGSGKANASKDVVDGLYKVQKAIDTLANKPQMTAQPVTNININALNGSFVSTSVTVTGVATDLTPEPIANRRGVIIYNNGSSTVYLGGIDVAVSGTGGGLPIASGNSSPAFDAGTKMKIYGITAGSSVDCRVLEMGTEASGR